MNAAFIEREIHNFFQDKMGKCNINGHLSNIGLLLIDIDSDSRKLAGRIDQKLYEEEKYATGKMKVGETEKETK